ncbi:Transcriptional regulatory protein, C terminal [Streptomyces sp. 3213]|uniref:BTAD domain-containing putative transcriptional regulator n=1 Tax=Streptomyces sp. 3213.3 TaxID=1855348 RepID=UPI000898DDF7|nr:BTAD domain-containing putative transcriptional regulator [Streptomyces sp. 3213.3]SEC15081.1 Transcriptional regulatory protein, C terminal [Streptomyces sp. 3213] [Streptomyces sp. 3213.3]
MEFGLLGSVEASLEGCSVELGHARQRYVLAALLADANRLVTVDQLVDRVWADRPAQRARDVLYGYVSRLRRVLAAGGVQIERRPGGYVLRVDATAVDLHRFRDLVARARATPQDAYATALFEQAVALWRGEAFTGLDTPWAKELREAWGQERLAAEIDLDDVRLRLGRHSELLAGLSVRADRHPWDERVAGQFMLALHRCGRSTEALARYQHIRRQLVKELGCDPGPALRQLHERILAADPGLASAPAGSVAVGALRSAASGAGHASQAGGRGLRPGNRLVGRAPELAIADRVLEDAAGGLSGVLEIVGDPGIGKTRLLGEIAERARHQGFQILTGRGTELTRMPYGIFVDAFDDHRDLAAGTLADSVRSTLGAIFPTPASSSRTRTAPLVAERYSLHRTMRSLLETLSSDTGLVLVLDDLHWADDESAELIRYLLRHPPSAPMVWALAYRPRQAPPRLPAELARPQTRQRVSRIDVGPLSPAEAAELCDGVTNRWLQQRLYEASGGNPFYLEALTKGSRAGLATPSGVMAVLEEGPSQPLRTLLQDELNELSATARATAQAASVIGESFEADLAAAVAQLDPGEVLAAFDELAERDVIRQDDASSRHFAFRHSLVRDAAYHSAGAGWRIAAHARVARALATRGASLAEQAPHVQRAASTGDEPAARLLAQAAEHVAPAAPMTAAHWIQNAIQLLGDRPNPLRQQWLFKQAEALGMAGRLHECLDVLRAAASQLTAEEGTLRARVTTAQAMTEWRLGRYQQAISLMLQELEHGSGLTGAETANLELGIAAVELRKAQAPAAIQWGERALRTLRRHDQPPQSSEDDQPLRIAATHALLAMGHTTAGNARQAQEHLGHVLTLVEHIDDDRLARHIDILALLGWTEMFRERYESALRFLDRGLELSRRTGQTAALADLLAASAYVLTWLGRLDEAAAVAETALDAAALVGSSEPCSLAVAAGAAVSLWRGDFAGALKACEESLAQTGPEPSANRAVITGMFGQALLLNGDPHGCIRSVIEAGGGDGLPRFEAPLRPLWYRLLTNAELARGDMQAAERWAGRAALAAAPAGPAGQYGFALLADAEARLARNDMAAASTAIRAAASFVTGRMPLYEASARITAGLALAAHGRPSEAISQFDHAERLAGDCGASGLRELAARERSRTTA